MAHATRAALERQADIVLGQRRLRRARVDEIVELGELDLARSKAPARESGAAAWSSTRRSARPSRPAPARGRIGVEPGRRLLAGRYSTQRLRQVMHVAGREVEALGAGRRHDVGGVAGQEQAAEAHRLGDEAAQRRDALLDRGPGDQRCARLVVEALRAARPRSARRASPRRCSSRRTARSSGCASASASSRARSRAGGGRRSARPRPAACRPGGRASRTDRRARRS